MITSRFAGFPNRSIAISKIAGSGFATPTTPEITMSRKCRQIGARSNRGTCTSANPFVSYSSVQCGANASTHAAAPGISS